MASDELVQLQVTVPPESVLVPGRPFPGAGAPS